MRSSLRTLQPTFKRQFMTNILLRNQQEEYKISHFKQGYPLAIDEQYRKSNYADLATDATWMDRTFLIPIRNRLAELTTTSWINLRFKKDPDDPPYFPQVFLKNSLLACKKFFQLLQVELKGEETESQLESVLTSKLYEQFKYHHEKLKERGLKLDIELVSIDNVRKGETFMSFGPPNVVTTTLTKAKVHKGQITPMVMWRYTDSPKRWIFNEMTFEYHIDPSLVEVDEDGDVDPPTLKTRTEATREGAVVGIEVIVDVALNVTIQDVQDPSRSWTKSMKRPMLFRFETEHFAKKYRGAIRIADIDNLFASTMME